MNVIKEGIAVIKSNANTSSSNSLSNRKKQTSSNAANIIDTVETCVRKYCVKK